MSIPLTNITPNNFSFAYEITPSSSGTSTINLWQSGNTYQTFSIQCGSNNLSELLLLQINPNNGSTISTKIFTLPMILQNDTITYFTVLLCSNVLSFNQTVASQLSSVFSISESSLSTINQYQGKRLKKSYFIFKKGIVTGTWTGDLIGSSSNSGFNLCQSSSLPNNNWWIILICVIGSLVIIAIILGIVFTFKNKKFV